MSRQRPGKPPVALLAPTLVFAPCAWAQEPGNPIDARVGGSFNAAESYQGPLDGSWTLVSVTGQALLAFASDGFLIATAMRPHKGVGQALAHVTISTTVMAQTLSFHEPFRADEWLLLAHHSPYAGRGRSYGRADVFTEDGRLVASYAQENVIRNLPEGQRPPPGQRAKV